MSGFCFKMLKIIRKTDSFHTLSFTPKGKMLSPIFTLYRAKLVSLLPAGFEVYISTKRFYDSLELNKIPEMLQKECLTKSSVGFTVVNRQRSPKP